MKKMRGDKKKINSSKRKKRFFSNNKFSVIVVIATFLLFSFLLATVHIGQPTGKVAADQGGVTDTVIKPITGFIHDLFVKWEGGNMDVNIAKYVIFFMLAGIIWGALNFAGFPDNIGFQALLALPAAFLATAYLTPQEVFAALQSWNALGITLIFVLPFMIAVLISAMLYSAGGAKAMTVGKILVGLLLWLTLAAVQVYKLIEGIVLGRIPWTLNMPLMISFGTTLLTVFIVIFSFKFRMWMWRLGLEVRAMAGQLTITQLEQAKNAMEQLAQLHAAAKAARKKS